MLPEIPPTLARALVTALALVTPATALAQISDEGFLGGVAPFVVMVIWVLLVMFVVAALMALVNRRPPTTLTPT